jgi:thiol-disulfide isomerase/thioredoxin
MGKERPMGFAARSRWLGHTLGLLLVSTAGTSQAATPSVDDALQLAPVQKDVEFDHPAASELSRCTIKAEQIADQTGWVVRNGNGQILRRFVDTNSDNVVDLWCYYDNGIEVYRDIDHNFNGKADQYRWLNTAGSRWALDTNEDGKIDTWKAISAEEVSAEVVRAIGDRDSTRFTRLLITKDELAGLGLGATHAKSIAGKLNDAPERFQAVLGGLKASGGAQNVSNAKPKWLNFGGSMPGTVPAGTDGSTKDVLVYENVVAMVQADEKHEQIPIGTLIQVGAAWRLIDAPSQQVAAAPSFFFPGASAVRPETPDMPDSDKKLQDLMAKLEQKDKDLATASLGEQPRLNAERADLVEKIAALSGGENRDLWMRQLADTVSAAVQSGAYPEGVERLKSLQEQLAKDNAQEDLLAYVEFRMLTADYGKRIQEPKPDFPALQKWWLESLEGFVKSHPKSADSAEAMLQVGIAQEFANEEDKAKDWYAKIVENFPDSAPAKKAAGAKTRLGCVGKAIQLQGQTPDGRNISLSQYKGKVIVIQYWSTTCEPCKSDMAQLKALLAKYTPDLAIVGVSLDTKKEDLVAFLKTTKLPWPQLYENGGLDSRLANELGVLTLPTMLLLDKQGKVVNRGIHVTELDREVGALLR